MGLRRFASAFAGGALAIGMQRLNARHPWSYKDHFHSWILANLPGRCRTALDVGCGQGDLLAALAPHVDRVFGNDIDAEMRKEAARRCAGRWRTREPAEGLYLLSAQKLQRHGPASHTAR